MRAPLILSLMLMLSACANPMALRGGSEADQRVAMFDGVVFSREYNRAKAQHLAKWARPVRIELKGKDAPRYRAAVAAHAKTLMPLTGLDIALAGPNERPNVTIFFAGLDEMEELAGPRIKNKGEVTDILLTSGCLFFFEKDARHRIRQATIFVRTGRTANDINACLLEEMVQILGLPNDSDLMRPSIFNAGDALGRLTPLDEALIRALYHPSIPVGAPRQQALEQARFLLRER